jgi:hypothetical protein
MSDAAIFISAFAGILVLRITGATLVFFWIVPRGDRCPNCDTATIRIQPTGFDRLMPWFRLSWCYACGWQGMLRHGELTPPPASAPPSKSPSTPARRSRS